MAQDPESSSSATPPPTSCFTCTRQNSTTFRIVEDDKWYEQPLVYVKITQDALVLVDTGCGGAARDPRVELTGLRDFLETYPVEDNDGKPLNEGGERDYVVVCTHCHYDHIGTIPCESGRDCGTNRNQELQSNSQTPNLQSGRVHTTNLFWNQINFPHRHCAASWVCKRRSTLLLTGQTMVAH
jgi:hypothetical protein